MNTPDLDAIRARTNAATPGPWWPRYGGEPGYVFASASMTLVAEVTGEKADAGPRPNSVFIAHARTDIPTLLTALDQARAAVARQATETEVANNTARQIATEYGHALAEIARMAIRTEKAEAQVAAVRALCEAESERWKAVIMAVRIWPDASVVHLVERITAALDGAVPPQPDQASGHAACGRDAGKRPSWMSPGQYDPCPCVRPKGHEGPCGCSDHDRPADAVPALDGAVPPPVDQERERKIREIARHESLNHDQAEARLDAATPPAAPPCTTYHLPMAVGQTTGCEVCGRPRKDHADEYVSTGAFTSTTRPIEPPAAPTLTYGPCRNDTNGDGDCATCARDPHAPCRAYPPTTATHAFEMPPAHWARLAGQEPCGHLLNPDDKFSHCRRPATDPGHGGGTPCP